MTARTKPGRRSILAIVAGIGPALMPGTSPAATAGPDAQLVALAADLRQAEGEYNALVDLEEDNRRNDERAASDRIADLVGAMADIPAEGLLGIAAKAGRLCWSLQPEHGGSLMYCEDVLAESLAADLARLAPHALGVQA